MELIQITCEIPLPRHCGLKYKGIAFDGCHYYLTCSDCCEIVKYDRQFCEVELIKTLRNYSCICFDPKGACFWAGARKFPNKLFKIDLCFQEVDCVNIPCCESGGGAITGVSYDCRRNRLLVCCTNAVLSVCPTAPKEYEGLQKSCLAWNRGVVSVSPGYLLVEFQSAKQMLCVYDCHGELGYKYEIPCDYVAEALLFAPCDMNEGRRPGFYLLATKNGCYPHLLEFALPCCEMDICHCNYDICHKCCEPCPKPPCPKPKNVCADLLESVALMETALSHILNAEGEKLQKVIATTDDVDKILCVNKSIQETIVKVTHLEIILHDKLTAIKECCCICEDDD